MELGKAEVTVLSRSIDGETPLHVMLWRQNTSGALMLIAAGADVNAVGDMSETPLHVAVRKGNLTVVEALLTAGAKTSAVSEFDQTPRSLACAAGGDMARLFANR